MYFSQKMCCMNNEETEAQGLGTLLEVYYNQMMDEDIKPKILGP